MTLPWHEATATGVGSMPGTSAAEAARIVAGELAAFPHAVELPARGPGADPIGRALALLHQVSADLGGDTTPTGWRIAAGDTRTMRRARSWLGEDLDALQEAAGAHAGPLKLQVAGPWTVAAGVELASGERMLRDPGACRELAAALGEAVRAHVADARRRFPSASIVLQVDEPGLPAVLVGRVGTASGLSAYRAVEPQTAIGALRSVLGAAADAGATPGAHCCAARPPVDLLRQAGAAFVSVDLLVDQDDDALGRAWEGGAGMLLGAVPSASAGPFPDSRAVAPVLALASRLGIADPALLGRVAVTASCGLSTASPGWARDALSACGAAARALRDDDEVREEEAR